MRGSKWWQDFRFLVNYPFKEKSCEIHANRMVIAGGTIKLSCGIDKSDKILNNQQL